MRSVALLCLGKQTAFYQEHPPAALWEVVQISGCSAAGCEEEAENEGKEEDEEEEEAVWPLRSEEEHKSNYFSRKKNN